MAPIECTSPISSGICRLSISFPPLNLRIYFVSFIKAHKVLLKVTSALHSIFPIFIGSMLSYPTRYRPLVDPMYKNLPEHLRYFISSGASYVSYSPSDSASDSFCAWSSCFLSCFSFLSISARVYSSSYWRIFCYSS